MFFYIVK